MPNRGGEGEADSRVGSGGPVPDKPLTSLEKRKKKKARKFPPPPYLENPNLLK